MGETITAKPFNLRLAALLAGSGVVEGRGPGASHYPGHMPLMHVKQPSPRAPPLLQPPWSAHLLMPQACLLRNPALYGHGKRRGGGQRPLSECRTLLTAGVQPSQVSTLPTTHRQPNPQHEQNHLRSNNGPHHGGQRCAAESARCCCTKL